MGKVRRYLFKTYQVAEAREDEVDEEDPIQYLNDYSEEDAWDELEFLTKECPQDANEWELLGDTGVIDEHEKEIHPPQRIREAITKAMILSKQSDFAAQFVVMYNHVKEQCDIMPEPSVPEARKDEIIFMTREW